MSIQYLKSKRMNQNKPRTYQLGFVRLALLLFKMLGKYRLGPQKTGRKCKNLGKTFTIASQLYIGNQSQIRNYFWYTSEILWFNYKNLYNDRILEAEYKAIIEMVKITLWVPILAIKRRSKWWSDLQVLPKKVFLCQKGLNWGSQ